MIGFAGKNHLSVDRVQIVALYDPKNGKIRHIQAVTTLRGAKPVTEEQVISDARQYASRRHKNSDRLAVALSNDAEHISRPHRIDLKTKSFVPISRGEKPSPKKKQKPSRKKKR
jgi:hypothetical protein